MYVLERKFLVCLLWTFSPTQDNQKDLEMATETLSEYLERDITSECLSDIKQKVQDKYRYAIQLLFLFTPLSIIYPCLVLWRQDCFPETIRAGLFKVRLS